MGKMRLFGGSWREKKKILPNGREIRRERVRNPNENPTETRGKATKDT
jgi:hypothetical protein